METDIKAIKGIIKILSSEQHRKKLKSLAGEFIKRVKDPIEIFDTAYEGGYKGVPMFDVTMRFLEENKLYNEFIVCNLNFNAFYFVMKLLTKKDKYIDEWRMGLQGRLCEE
jgi:hypothetical protein